MLTRLIALFFIMCFCGDLCAADTVLPDTVEPDGRYVFYSHGFIVEGDNPRPQHPRWGVYDYPAVVKALKDDSYTLIAHHRPKGIAPSVYAETLAGFVRALIDKGVRPQNISLVGFSRGGALTILASDVLKNTEVNFAILAGCGKLVSQRPDVTLSGRILSVYETSDTVGSCDTLRARSPGIVDYKEIAISTGKEHGAFYLPRDAWVLPVRAWLNASTAH